MLQRAAPFMVCVAREAVMDLVKALSVYRVAIIEAIGKLDDFPEELKEFAAEERRHLARLIHDDSSDGLADVA